MSPSDARKLAEIFARVQCRDVLANECSWVWPDLPWHELVEDEKAKVKSV